MGTVKGFVILYSPVIQSPQQEEKAKSTTKGIKTKPLSANWIIMGQDQNDYVTPFT